MLLKLKLRMPYTHSKVPATEWDFGIRAPCDTGQFNLKICLVRKRLLISIFTFAPKNGEFQLLQSSTPMPHCPNSSFLRLSLYQPNPFGSSNTTLATPANLRVGFRQCFSCSKSPLDTNVELSQCRSCQPALMKLTKTKEALTVKEV